MTVRVRSDIGRYAIVPEWVIAKLSPRALKLYAMLAVYADRDTGKSWYSRRALGKALRCSTDTIDRMVRECVDAGTLVVSPRFRDSGATTSNNYFVITVEGGAANVRWGSRNGDAAPAAELRSLLEPETSEPETEKEPSCATDVARVWSSYQQHHPAAKLTADRRQLITRRLKEYPAETLVAAVEGNHESAFHNGENPMGKAYHNLSLILRNADYIEGFAELHEPSAEKRSWSDEEWRAEMRRLGAPV